MRFDFLSNLGKTAQNMGFSRIFYSVTESDSTENSCHFLNSGFKLLFLARWLQEKKVSDNHFRFWLSEIPRSLVWFFPKICAIFLYLCRYAIYAVDLFVCLEMHGSKGHYCSDHIYHCNHKLLPPFFFFLPSLFPYCYSWQLDCKEYVLLDRQVLTQVAWRMQRDKQKNRRQDGRKMEGVIAWSGAPSNWSLRKWSH